MPELPDSQIPHDNLPQPDTPPPAPQQPVGAPPPKSRSALKAVLIFFAVLIGLGAIGGGILSYVFSHIAQSVNTGSSDQAAAAAKNTPAPTMTADSSDKFTESDLGIAIYPGAEPGEGGMRMDMGGKTLVSAIFLTQDSKEQVIAFYKDKVGPVAQMMMTTKGTEFILNNNTGDSVTVTIQQTPGTNDGKTQIAIVHTSKSSASN
jgi:hypothetical protein